MIIRVLIEHTHRLKKPIKTLLEKIMATEAQLVAQLNTLTQAVTKIGSETTTLIQKVSDLSAALADAETTPEVDAALAALQAQVQVVDDLVPDVPPVVPPAA